MIIICLIAGIELFFSGNFLRKIPRQTVIQFASWGSESEIKILKPILADFEKENPDIKIDFLHIPQNYFQKIHLLFASNTAPDIIFINNQYLPIYANSGTLEDLTTYTELNFEDFYPKSIESLSWNNKIYAVPRDISNLVVFYNKDIFDKYKIKYPSKNWTQADFLNIAQKLSKNGIFGVSFDEEPLFYLPYLTSNGGWTRYDTENYFKKDVLQSENNKYALNFYADLRRKYHASPRREEAGSATMAQLFLQQKIGMYISGRWMVPKFREDANFDWDIAEFPAGNLGSIVPMDASGWAISKSSKHKKEALKLLKYLSSSQSMEKFTQSGLIVPARTDISESKVFLDGEKPQNAKVFLDVAKTSVPTPVTVNYREITDDLKIKTEYMFNDI